MGRPLITFEVRGIPVPQGSKDAFVNPKTGKAIVVESGGAPHKNWRASVALRAQDAMNGSGLMDGPVRVTLTFRLPRPASEPKTKRTYPVKARSGDVDKLARAVLDALTGVVFGDDSQVVTLVVNKDFGDPGVRVKVWPLPSFRLA